MTGLLKPLQWLYVIYALIIFIVPMLVIFPLALVAMLFGRIKGGYLIYRLCMVWADIWFPLVFIPHRNIYEEKPESGKAYIFVANHTSYMDAAIIPKAIRQPVRPLGKVEMARIPIFGFIYKNVIVTVDRSSPENRAASVRILRSVLSKGISVLVFPEGTFNETGNPLKEFYDGAFRIAIETGTPIMPILFLESYDRMDQSSLFSLNPGKSRAVFLASIATTGLTLQELPALKQQVYAEMENKLRQYKASWIKPPVSESEV